MSDNYYEELGVDPAATRDEIREAHRARVAELEAARSKKGVTDEQLEDNRDEVARVRAAWNVLSDPYQRGRYDQSLESAAEVELVDDDEGAGDTGAAPTQLTGWRRILAPPPAKPSAGSNGKQPPAKGNRPEPTLVLPGGMKIAEPRARGMALLFDLSVVIVIFFGLNIVLPGLIKSDYSHTQTQISRVNDLHDARSSIDDAVSSLSSAKTASAKSSAQKDLKKAQQDFTKAATAAKKEGVTWSGTSDGSTIDHKSDQPTTAALDKKSTDLQQSQVGTQYITAVVALLLALLYLVPSTARKGRTLGMRNRKVRVVMVDGSKVGWWPAFLRFFIALAPTMLLLVPLATIAPIIGLGIVGWAFFDRNRQGLHDKLAHTVVVDA